MLETNWYVLTGGPSCGKSTIVNALAYRGYTIRPEAARLWIDEEMSRGKTLAQIRENELGFQYGLIDIKLKAESAADPKAVIFWDRGMPDSLAYLKRCGADLERAVEASGHRRYKKVFLLDRPPTYAPDYCRRENDSEADEVHRLLDVCYRQVGYDVINVPVLPVPERLEFILQRVN